MSRKAEKKEHFKIANTFIDKGVTIQAQKLSGSESVRIDGIYIGDIELDSYLQVGETGRIEGNVQVSYALIAGEVHGNILCNNTVHLSDKARIHGNVESKSIIIDKGAVFHGFCETRKIEPASGVVVL